MKKSESRSSKKIPGLSIDPSLDRLSSMVLFPAKLERANLQIRKAGFPVFEKVEVKKSR